VQSPNMDCRRVGCEEPEAVLSPAPRRDELPPSSVAEPPGTPGAALSCCVVLAVVPLDAFSAAVEPDDPPGCGAAPAAPTVPGAPAVPGSPVVPVEPMAPAAGDEEPDAVDEGAAVDGAAMGGGVWVTVRLGMLLLPLLLPLRLPLDWEVEDELDECAPCDECPPCDCAWTARGRAAMAAAKTRVFMVFILSRRLRSTASSPLATPRPNGGFRGLTRPGGGLNRLVSGAADAGLRKDACRRSGADIDALDPCRSWSAVPTGHGRRHLEEKGPCAARMTFWE